MAHCLWAGVVKPIIPLGAKLLPLAVLPGVSVGWGKQTSKFQRS